MLVLVGACWIVSVWAMVVVVAVGSSDAQEEKTIGTTTNGSKKTGFFMMFWVLSNNLNSLEVAFLDGSTGKNFKRGRSGLRVQ